MNEATREAMAHIKGTYPPIPGETNADLAERGASPENLNNLLGQGPLRGRDQAAPITNLATLPYHQPSAAAQELANLTRRTTYMINKALGLSPDMLGGTEAERALRWRDCRIAAQQQVIAERDAEIARLLAQNAMLLANPLMMGTSVGPVYRWGVDMATGTAQWVATGTKTDQPRDQGQRHDHTPLRDAQGSQAYDRCHGFGDPDPTPPTTAAALAALPPLPGRALNAGTVKTGLFVP